MPRQQEACVLAVGGETDKLSNAAEQAAKQVGKAVETSHTLIVQEYLDGGTLKKMLLAEVRLPVSCMQFPTCLPEYRAGL